MKDQDEVSIKAFQKKLQALKQLGVTFEKYDKEKDQWIIEEPTQDLLGDLANKDKRLSISIEQQLANLEELSSWLEHSIGNTSKSRITRYKKFFEQYLAHINSGKFVPENNDLDHKLYDEMMYTLREVHELNWIYGAFKNEKPKGWEEKFQKILGGSTYARDDITTTARDHQLELRIASYFLRAKYQIDLSQSADIVATSSKRNFFIECKRLYSPKQIKKRVREAAHQLEKRLTEHKDSKKNIGIAVFDVTKLAFPHQGLTWGFSNDHCRDVIRAKLEELAGAYDFSAPFLNNRNILLVWLQIHIPSLNLLTAQPTTRFSSIFIQLSPQIFIHASAFEELQKVLEVYTPE